MNKLREEVLLKIEEMGLLLSKELRDRVAEERALRKQTLADFDLKIREFIKSVSASQSSLVAKLSKKVTQLAKDTEESERGWKQGVGSVANVIRSLQPALDKEIATRTANEAKMNRKLEESMTAIATEVEMVTGKAFQQIEDLGQKVQGMQKKVEELAHRQFTLENTVKTDIERAKVEILQSVMAAIEEERKARQALENSMRDKDMESQLNQQRLSGQLDNIQTRAEQEAEQHAQRLKEADTKQSEALNKLKDLTQQAMQRSEEDRSAR